MIARIAAAFLFGCAGAAAAQVPLVEAARSGDTQAVLALLAERADANQAEPDGTTPLHWAVYHDDATLVARLLAAGAEVGVANDYGATPMSEAAVAANPTVLAALLDAGADADSPNAEGQTALMVVARGGNTAAARLLLERGANANARETRKGQTALMWAVAQGHVPMAKLLLEHGADVDARSAVNDWERMVTAEPRQKNLMSGGFTPLLYAARQGCLECAQALLAAGAKIELADPDGVTPLLSALLNGHFDLAKYLLEQGASVNKWDFWGRSPLYLAVDYNTLPHGGRPDRPSLDDTTSLAMIEILLAAGANPNAQLKLFPPYRSLRMDRGADPLLDIGATPLLRAARGADVPAIERLVAAGALVDLPQREGVTPLMTAVGANAGSVDTRGRFRTEPQALAATAALLAAGAGVDVRDALGRTALHYAAAMGYASIVKLLAEHGAELAPADAEGLTPLDAANGKLRGRGRGAGAVHADAVAMLDELLATAAR